MRTIEYQATYSGTITPEGIDTTTAREELISVRARDINAGFSKALKIAAKPLGNGRRLELIRLEFWQIP